MIKNSSSNSLNKENNSYNNQFVTPIKKSSLDVHTNGNNLQQPIRNQTNTNNNKNNISPVGSSSLNVLNRNQPQQQQQQQARQITNGFVPHGGSITDSAKKVAPPVPPPRLDVKEDNNALNGYNNRRNSLKSFIDNFNNHFSYFNSNNNNNNNNHDNFDEKLSSCDIYANYACLQQHSNGMENSLGIYSTHNNINNNNNYNYNNYNYNATVNSNNKINNLGMNINKIVHSNLKLT